MPQFVFPRSFTLLVALAGVLLADDQSVPPKALLGLNHERLSFYNNGIERRLTDVHGHVVKDVLA